MTAALPACLRSVSARRSNKICTRMMYAIQTVVLSSVVVGHLSFYAYLGTKIMKSVSRGLELDSLDPSDTIQAAQTRVRIEILRSRGKEQWFSKRSRR